LDFLRFIYYCIEWYLHLKKRELSQKS